MTKSEQFKQRLEELESSRPKLHLKGIATFELQNDLKLKMFAKDGSVIVVDAQTAASIVNFLIDVFGSIPLTQENVKDPFSDVSYVSKPSL